MTPHEADALRQRYWQRYGATLLGLVRHHGVRAAHFLHHTHLLPGLEAAVRGHAHDLAALARLRGRKFILTNAPRAYAERVLGVLGIAPLLRRRDQRSRTCTCSASCGPSPTRACCAAWRRGCACRPRAACWSRTRCSTRRRRARVGMTHGVDAALARRRCRGLLHADDKACRNAGKSAFDAGRKPAYVCARIASLQQAAPPAR